MLCQIYVEALCFGLSVIQWYPPDKVRFVADDQGCFGIYLRQSVNVVWEWP